MAEEEPEVPNPPFIARRGALILKLQKRTVHLLGQLRVMLTMEAVPFM